MRQEKNEKPPFWTVFTPGKPETDTDLFGFCLPAGKLTEEQLTAFLNFVMGQRFPAGLRFQLKNAQRNNRFMKFWLAKNHPDILKDLTTELDRLDEDQRRKDMKNFNKLL